MISLHNLCKSFHGIETKEALSNICIDIHAGDFILLIGENGSGKSTLLNLISGEILPDSGTFMIDGKDLTNWPSYKRAALVSRIFQDPVKGTAGDLSIVDNLRLASLRTGARTLKNSNTPSFRKKIKEELSKLEMGLENRLDTRAENLSGGQRQALSLIMAVQSSTRLLLLDEPSSALDPRAAARITGILEKIHADRELSLLMVSHNMHESVNLGNRLIQLSRGKIIRDLHKNRDNELNAAQLYQWIGEAETS